MASFIRGCYTLSDCIYRSQEFGIFHNSSNFKSLPNSVEHVIILIRLHHHISTKKRARTIECVIQEIIFSTQGWRCSIWSAVYNSATSKTVSSLYYVHDHANWCWFFRTSLWSISCGFISLECEGKYQTLFCLPSSNRWTSRGSQLNLTAISMMCDQLSTR